MRSTSCARCPPGDIGTVGERETLVVDGRVLPLVRLATLFGGRRVLEREVLGCACEPRLLAGALRAPVHHCDVLGGTDACVPLTAGGSNHGLLHLLTGPAPLTNDDLQVLGTVGNQIGVALERANLKINEINSLESMR